MSDNHLIIKQKLLWSCLITTKSILHPQSLCRKQDCSLDFTIKYNNLQVHINILYGKNTVFNHQNSQLYIANTFLLCYDSMAKAHSEETGLILHMN